MFALIPGFRKKADAPSSGCTSRRASHYPSPCEPATLPASEVLPVPLRPSRQLWYAQCLVHAVLAISVTMAVMPLVSVQPSWGFLWLAGMAGLSISLRACYRHWRSLPCVLRITEQGWVLDHGDSQRAIVLAGDAVVLSWLMVLPCRDTHNRARLYVVILPDSTSPDMHRRLRVWLRTRR